MNDITVKEDRKRTLLPVCRIAGDENTVTLQVEMPGVHKNDIEVRIDGDQLIITGKQSEAATTGAWLLRERRRGDFYRSFTIDQTINRDKIDAVYELGIMTVTLQVREEVKPRKIEILGK